MSVDSRLAIERCTANGTPLASIIDLAHSPTISSSNSRHRVAQRRILAARVRSSRRTGPASVDTIASGTAISDTRRGWPDGAAFGGPGHDLDGAARMN
ncbi:MAG: hypothetical protein U1E90_04020 [Burkholderiaceae bacterium]